MIAARDARALSINYDRIIHSIDWNRVLLQARGQHSKTHADQFDTCGYCLQEVLLRQDE